MKIPDPFCVNNLRLDCNGIPLLANFDMIILCCLNIFFCFGVIFMSPAKRLSAALQTLFTTGSGADLRTEEEILGSFETAKNVRHD